MGYYLQTYKCLTFCFVTLIFSNVFQTSVSFAVSIHINIISRDVQEMNYAFVIVKLTFLADLDGASGLYPLPVFVPFS